MRKISALSTATLLAALVFLPSAALAAPQNTQVVDVFECVGSGCSSNPLPTGSVVDGDIQVTVSSSSPIGLEWLRVEGRRKGDTAWTCLQQWSGQVSATSYATNMERDYRWSTTVWPSASATGNNCPASIGGDGSRTANGEYELRARAREANTGSQQPTSNDTVHFKVKIANKATTPSWAKSPTLIDTGSKKLVELKWNTVPDPDVVEYRFIRSGPDGTRAYAVSASSPGGQGCSGPRAPAQGVITCYDDDFPSSDYGGTYRYSLQAFRSTPETGPSCSQITSAPCIGSGVSSQQTAEVNEPSPSPSPSNSPSGSISPSTRPRSTPRGSTSPSGSPSSSSSPSRVLSDSSEFYTGTYDDQLPYDSQRGFTSLPGSDGSNSGAFDDPGTGQTLASGDGGFGEEPVDRRVSTSIAAGLLMVLIAMHIARLLYDR